MVGAGRLHTGESMGIGQQATEGPSTPREDHGKSTRLGIKEHVLKKRQDVVGRERIDR